jgi:hypothetical protein
MCATKTSYVIEIPSSPVPFPAKRPAFLRALTILVDAFREARAMQRAAQRRRLLNDE